MRNKKIFIQILAGLLAALLAAAALIFWMSEHVRIRGEALLHAEAGESPEPQPTAIVLGAAVWPGNVPSHMLEDRVLTAVRLYHEGRAAKLLMSGNRDGGYNEPDVMARLAISKGVPETAILLDYAGYTTRITMQNAARDFDIREAVIVTQAYHLPRALYLGEKAGMRVAGAAADLRRYLDFRKDLVREFFARAKAWVQEVW